MCEKDRLLEVSIDLEDHYVTKFRKTLKKLKYNKMTGHVEHRLQNKLSDFPYGFKHNTEATEFKTV